MAAGLGWGVSLFPHEAVCLFLFFFFFNISFLLKKIILFLAVVGLHWCLGFSAGAAGRGCSPVVCGGFSCGAQTLGHAGFRSCGSQALEYRLNSCGSHGLVLRSMWHLPYQELNLCLLP